MRTSFSNSKRLELASIHGARCSCNLHSRYASVCNFSGNGGHIVQDRWLLRHPHVGARLSDVVRGELGDGRSGWCAAQGLQVGSRTWFQSEIFEFCFEFRFNFWSISTGSNMSEWQRRCFPFVWKTSRGTIFARWSMRLRSPTERWWHCWRKRVVSTGTRRNGAVLHRKGCLKKFACAF